jgi:serine/threonine protein phosphatase 1
MNTVRTYVIGDIHGCLDELVWLLEGLPLGPADRLVFLGDYIDRGPESNAVISYLIERQETRSEDIIFLKGNHEDMFLAYMGFPGKYGDMFLYNGGSATLTSYGAAAHTPGSPDILLVIPHAHIKFLKELRSYYITGGFLCIHAGINPKKPLEMQDEEETLWVRDEFIHSPHDLPYTVLFGHTPQDDVLFHLPYKIGLDTGLVYGNRLSCLELSEKVLFQVARGKKEVIRRSVKDHWSGASPVP